eukprot:CAMPEP_0181201398 /NCGR_PEP_ID=MMETSP1096-20121128/18286_1 /TAXON_ID=156174 ORGANISM="Chrysochromulina ericina, Strain CCMP281" /NCGR_SAMPLE_ID=MMETSP1096 /ASSEMBLY_ACC=CAM_ASM_000453 /LENGTH=52 /DNA_ID=CAMNT_0023291839 /DNA_START=456 /DNA_END=614 /DNA_ORIENTATION=+
MHMPHRFAKIKLRAHHHESAYDGRAPMVIQFGERCTAPNQRPFAMVVTKGPI